MLTTHSPFAGGPGDMGYADDTAIVGEADEVVAADGLFKRCTQQKLRA